MSEETKPEVKVVAVKISVELHKALRVKAAETGQTVQALVTAAISSAVA